METNDDMAATGSLRLVVNSEASHIGSNYTPPNQTNVYNCIQPKAWNHICVNEKMPSYMSSRR